MVATPVVKLSPTLLGFWRLGRWTPITLEKNLKLRVEGEAITSDECLEFPSLCFFSASLLAFCSFNNSN